MNKKRAQSSRQARKAKSQKSGKPTATNTNLPQLLQQVSHAPNALTPNDIAHLQRSVGNQSLAHYINPKSPIVDRQSLTIQPKLTINAVGDKHEQKADGMSKQVVQKLYSPQSSTDALITQRKIEQKMITQLQELEDKEAMAHRQEKFNSDFSLGEPFLGQKNGFKPALLGKDLTFDQALSPKMLDLSAIETQLNPAYIIDSLEQVNYQNYFQRHLNFQAPEVQSKFKGLIEDLKIKLQNKGEDIKDQIMDLNLGEKTLVFSTVGMIAAGSFLGIMSNPKAQKTFGKMVGSKLIPIPGIKGLQVELNFNGKDCMALIHFDLGAYLPSFLGFSQSKPQKMGFPSNAESNSANLQRQELADKEMMVQSQPQDYNHGSIVDSNAKTKINQSSGIDRPIEESIQQSREQSLSTDFSQFYIHTDSQANSFNNPIQSPAFDTDQGAYFKEGVYRLQATLGQQPLTQKLTHIVQKKQSQLLAPRKKPLGKMELLFYQYISEKDETQKETLKNVIRKALKVKRFSYSKSKLRAYYWNYVKQNFEVSPSSKWVLSAIYWYLRGEDKPTSTSQTTQSVKIQKNNGEHVLYEYKGGEVARPKFHSKNGRFYQKGDIILIDKTNKTQFQKELQKKQERSIDVWSILSFFFDEEEQLITGWQITEINQRIQGQRVIIYKNKIVPTEKSGSWSAQELSDSFNMLSHAKKMKEIIPYLEMVAELASGPHKKIVKKAGKKFTNKILKKYLKKSSKDSLKYVLPKIRNYLLRELIKGFPIALKTLAKEVSNDYVLFKNKQKILGSQAGDFNLSTSLSTHIDDAINTYLEEVIEKNLVKHIRERGLANILDDDKDEIKKVIGLNFTEQLTLFIREKMITLFSVQLRAINAIFTDLLFDDSFKSETERADIIVKRLNTHLHKEFKKVVKQLFDDLSKDAMKDLSPFREE